MSAATLPTSMDGLQGANPSEQITNAAAKTQLLVVGRSTCPFCIEVTRTFADMGLPYTYYQGGWRGGGVFRLVPALDRV